MINQGDTVRNVVVAAVLIAASHLACAAEGACPAIGAIRWDAWHGASGGVGRHVEKTLGPGRYHYRLPFCSRILGPDQVEIECDSQEIVDQEIRYAAAAGLGYWIFHAHEPDNAMSRSFNFYLSSTHKAQVKFALYSSPRLMGNSTTYAPRVSRYVQHMKDPSYQTVAGGRPLFFIGFIPQDMQANWEGPAGFRAAIESLRSEARRAGLPNPYIVVMEFRPERARQHVDLYGFDAITSYATRAGNSGAPYSYLARGVEKHWERLRATGAQVVPIVMTGWDDRPKAENPIRPAAPGARGRLGMYYEQARPAEIADHLGNAIRWVAAHPGAASANTIIVYAWNEHDEGGWLNPTLAEGAARVEALGKLVDGACPRGARSGGPTP